MTPSSGALFSTDRHVRLVERQAAPSTGERYSPAIPLRRAKTHLSRGVTPRVAGSGASLLPKRSSTVSGYRRGTSCPGEMRLAPKRQDRGTLCSSQVSRDMFGVQAIDSNALTHKFLSRICDVHGPRRINFKKHELKTLSISHVLSKEYPSCCILSLGSLLQQRLKHMPGEINKYFSHSLHSDQYLGRAFKKDGGSFHDTFTLGATLCRRLDSDAWRRVLGRAGSRFARIH